MDRRKFLIQSLLGTSAVLLPTFLTACKDDDLPVITTDKKIIIIGGGIAGLATAQYLKRRGVNTILFESQDRVGGRIRTDRSLGFAFDEGASWIHGPKGNPITDIADEAGMDTVKTDDNSVSVFDIDGKAYIDSIIDPAESEFEDIIESLSGTEDQSFADAFYGKYPQYKNNRLWTYFLSAYLEFDTGGDITKLSSLDFDNDEEFSGKDVIAVNGFDKVTEHLKSGLDIRLNTKVLDVDYSGNQTLIKTDQGDFEADYVAVTVPLGVLKQDVIGFKPALPTSKKSAIDAVEMGVVNKFVCTWDNVFWDNDLQYIGFTPETKGKFNYFLNIRKYTNTNALMTFAFGNYAKQSELMTDSEIKDDIMSHLKIIYGNGIPAPSGFARTRWLANEHAFGSYSFATNGTRSTAFDELGKPVGNTLFFAGEHTIKDYRGTVHGAYLSGERAGEEIANKL